MVRPTRRRHRRQTGWSVAILVISLQLNGYSSAWAQAPRALPHDASIKGVSAPLIGSSTLESRMLAITNELRCLVCQNQTIAESNADLAVDLRAQVRAMLTHGRDEEEIRRYMTDRYGDFILYRPPLKRSTSVLWLGPLLLLALSILILIGVLQRRTRLADNCFEPDPALDETEEAGMTDSPSSPGTRV